MDDRSNAQSHGQEQQALLPCPFCGSPAEVEHSADGESVSVGCTADGCPAGPWVGEQRWREPAAIAAWNTRTGSKHDAYMIAVRKNRDLSATIERLAGALRELLDPRLDPSAWYDREAEAFYRESGLMAPGKSRPMAMGGQDEEQAERLWRAFRERRNGEVVRRATAAMEGKS